jgi:pimeloyl-ACP methyl ester carboxylesterase
LEDHPHIPSRIEYVKSDDGIRLCVEVVRGSRRATVVLLHGGGQTRGAWGGAAEVLADAGWSTVAADCRGHGDSQWAPDGDYSTMAFAADVASIVRWVGSPVVLAGASLGGISALRAVAENPELPVTGIVLVDVAHRFEQAGAERIVGFMRSRLDGFSSAEEASQAVAAYLPHRPPPAGSGLDRNLREREGRLHWHWDPALLDISSELLIPTGAERNEQTLRRTIEGLSIPTRLVRGAKSEIITHEIAQEFLTLNPNADLVEVPGARHMVAGDRNDRFTAAVLDFLETRIG